MPINSSMTYQELISEYHKDSEKYVFFVGSGLSQPVFPSWSSLLKKFVAQAVEVDKTFPKDEIIGYINEGVNYLEIAEECVQAMGATRYRDLMEDVFDINLTETHIPPSYQALMDLAPKVIITTNYDRLPDIAGKGLYRVNTNKNAAEATRSITNKKNVLFKIHGEITDQSSIILQSSDYKRIMHKDTATRQALTSILSSKILVFIGFSLSDPHIELILESLNLINKGLSIAHYVLLNNPTDFLRKSFERKYGVKIISYTPSNSSHHEVVEFLQALSHELKTTPIEDEKKIIKNISDEGLLISYLNDKLSTIFINIGFSIFYEKNNIIVSFTPNGGTNSEIQKEILTVIRQIDFESNLVEKLSIYIIAQTPPNTNINKSQQVILSLELDFNFARMFSNKEISTKSLWEEIDFFSPVGLSEIFSQKEKVTFPLSTGIIGVYT